MSYYLCGQFNFKGTLPLGVQKKISFKLVEAMLEEKLSLQLECNLTQSQIYEILGKQDDVRWLQGKNLAFHITDSPIWDVSDELINPGVHDNFDQPIPILTDSLSRVQRAMQKILEIPEIDTIHLYCSQGYDTSYAEIPITVDQLVARSIEWYTNQEPPHEMHGVKFIITH